MLSLETAREWYPQDDPVHGFDHIVRVYRLAELLAAAEGADMEIVRAAALLHDAQDTAWLEAAAGDSPTNNAHERRSNHQQSAALFTQRILQSEGWSKARIDAVLHCIRAHRFRDDSENPDTLEAQVLYDADKLDAIGAIGAARAVAYAVKASQPIYSPPSALFMQTGKTQAGEAHSAYHEYIYNLRTIKDRMYTTAGKRLAAERHRKMSDFFEQLQTEWQAGA
jgi:uncharacterized protein